VEDGKRKAMWRARLSYVELGLELGEIGRCSGTGGGLWDAHAFGGGGQMGGCKEGYGGRFGGHQRINELALK
jgi:hypothetical protein